MLLIRREDYAKMPWRNGQGMTEEIVSFPPESTLADFDWRLSIAHVEKDGPFSVFPGVDRTIALLKGSGLVLDLATGDSTTLTRSGSPYSFPGEWDVASRNLDGPTIDLNIMTRRSRLRHRMERISATGAHVVEAKDLTLLIPQDPVVLRGTQQDWQARAFDTALLQPGESVTAMADKAFSILIIRLKSPETTE